MNKAQQGLVFVVSAPSGAGKSSLVNALREKVNGLSVAVSHTTRDMRPGEQDGREYHFTPMADFLAMIEEDAFVEHAKVYGNRYGTSHGAINAERDAGRDVLVEIDWQGARKVRAAIPDAISVFILPPSRGALEERLRNRGQDSEQIIAGRMQTARDEITHWNEYDYVIINDQFDVALEDLVAIVRGQRLQTRVQTHKQAGLLAELES